MSADDIAALDVAKLGSGVTLYGYYMFHGGTNPDGKLTTLAGVAGHRVSAGPAAEVVRFPGAARRIRADASLVPRFEDASTCSCTISERTLAPMTAYFPPEMPTGKQDRANAACRGAVRFA